MEDRLIKAINFFRKFDNKSDSLIYRKSVLKFCDLVEEYIGTPKEEIDMLEVAKEVFEGKGD